MPQPTGNKSNTNIFVNDTEVSSSNPLPVSSVSSAMEGSSKVLGGVVGSATNMVFDNDQAADTEVTAIDFTQLSDPRDVTALIAYNPGATDITLQIFSYNGTNYWHVTDISVPISAALITTVRQYYQYQIRGMWAGGSGCRIIPSNDTLIAADGAFTGTIMLVQV